MEYLWGGGVFFLLFGCKIIDVTNIEWLENKGDMTSQFHLWQFYRNSDWFFPIGLMDNVNYPEKISVFYGDNIPLFAITFKFFSPILPVSFQYFGLYNFLCYILQGFFSVLIFGRYVKNQFTLFVFVIILLYSPWLFQRSFYHVALASHWIILWCIYICLDGKNFSLKKDILVWGGIFFLTPLIHLYIVPMCVVFLFWYETYKALIHKCGWKMWLSNLGIIFSICIALSLFVLWLIGAFYGHPDYNIGGLGDASANLHFLFNPVGKSAFLSDFPDAKILWPEEGFGYLGLGMIIVLFFVIITSIIKCCKNRLKGLPICSSAEGAHDYKVETLIIALLIATFVLIASMPRIAWNNITFITWQLPNKLSILFSTFRSLGRFVWPVCYIITIICLIWVNKFLNKGRILFLSLILFLQLADFYPWYSAKGNEIRTVKTYGEFNIPKWNYILKDYKHFWIYDFDSNWDVYGELASLNGLTINDTYINRKNVKQMEVAKEETLKGLMSGDIDEDTIYILPSNPSLWAGKIPFNVYYESNLYICVKDELSSEFQKIGFP